MGSTGRFIRSFITYSSQWETPIMEFGIRTPYRPTNRKMCKFGIAGVYIDGIFGGRYSVNGRFLTVGKGEFRELPNV